MVAFFLGLFLRSASLYHPQRDAISHIKYQVRKNCKILTFVLLSQKEKVKPINPKDKLKQKKEQSDLFDLSFVRNRNMRIYLASSGTGALGMYTPLFHLAGHLHQVLPPCPDTLLISSPSGTLFRTSGRREGPGRRPAPAPALAGTVHLLWLYYCWHRHHGQLQVCQPPSANFMLTFSETCSSRSASCCS